MGTKAQRVIGQVPPNIAEAMSEVQALAAQTNSRAVRIDRWDDGSQTEIVCLPGEVPTIAVHKQPDHEPPFYVNQAKKHRWWRRKK